MADQILDDGTVITEDQQQEDHTLQGRSEVLDIDDIDDIDSGAGTAPSMSNIAEDSFGDKVSDAFAGVSASDTKPETEDEPQEKALTPDEYGDEFKRKYDLFQSMNSNPQEFMYTLARFEADIRVGKYQDRRELGQALKEYENGDDIERPFEESDIQIAFEHYSEHHAGLISSLKATAAEIYDNPVIRDHFTVQHMALAESAVIDSFVDEFRGHLGFSDDATDRRSEIKALLNPAFDLNESQNKDFRDFVGSDDFEKDWDNIEESPAMEWLVTNDRIEELSKDPTRASDVLRLTRHRDALANAMMEDPREIYELGVLLGKRDETFILRGEEHLSGNESIPRIQRGEVVANQFLSLLTENHPNFDKVRDVRSTVANRNIDDMESLDDAVELSLKNMDLAEEGNSDDLRKAWQTMSSSLDSRQKQSREILQSPATLLRMGLIESNEIERKLQTSYGQSKEEKAYKVSSRVFGEKLSSTEFTQLDIADKLCSYNVEQMIVSRMIDNGQFAEAGFASEKDAQAWQQMANTGVISKKETSFGQKIKNGFGLFHDVKKSSEMKSFEDMKSSYENIDTKADNARLAKMRSLRSGSLDRAAAYVASREMASELERDAFDDPLKMKQATFADMWAREHAFENGKKVSDHARMIRENPEIADMYRQDFLRGKDIVKNRRDFQESTVAKEEPEDVIQREEPKKDELIGQELLKHLQENQEDFASANRRFYGQSKKVFPDMPPVISFDEDKYPFRNAKATAAATSKLITRARKDPEGALKLYNKTVKMRDDLFAGGAIEDSALKRKHDELEIYRRILGKALYEQQLKAKGNRTKNKNLMLIDEDRLIDDSNNLLHPSAQKIRDSDPARVCDANLGIMEGNREKQKEQIETPAQKDLMKQKKAQERGAQVQRTVGNAANKSVGFINDLVGAMDAR